MPTVEGSYTTLGPLHQAWGAEDAVRDAYEQRDFAKAIREIMRAADAVNEYFDKYKPWELAKDQSKRDDLHIVCTNCIRAFQVLTVYLAPILPGTAARAYQSLLVSTGVRAGRM